MSEASTRRKVCHTCGKRKLTKGTSKIQLHAFDFPSTDDWLSPKIAACCKILFSSLFFFPAKGWRLGTYLTPPDTSHSAWRLALLTVSVTSALMILLEIAVFLGFFPLFWLFNEYQSLFFSKCLILLYPKVLDNMLFLIMVTQDFAKISQIFCHPHL